MGEFFWKAATWKSVTDSNAPMLTVVAFAGYIVPRWHGALETVVADLKSVESLRGRTGLLYRRGLHACPSAGRSEDHKRAKRHTPPLLG